MDKRVVIVGAVRTPIGAIAGSLSKLTALDLMVVVLKGLLEKTEIDPKLIEYVSVGWVLQDPRFPNISKIAHEIAGIPNTVPGTTFQENCASGAAAVHDIARRILLDEIQIGIGAGVESMSNVPRLLYKGRVKNVLYGDLILEDGIMGGLKDNFVGKGELMGLLTERLVEKYKVSREEQDEIAYRSHQNALKAWKEGYFSSDYILKVEVPQKRKPPVIVEKDEGPKDISLDVIKSARPYFKPDGGTITALNASTINDGAAAVLLMSEKKCRELGFSPLAYLRAYHNIGVPREYMGEGAFKVIPPLLKKAELSINDIDYFEINEAFAAVVGAAFKFLPELKVDKVNQWGSGISLGHPVGCTGARQIVDMVHQLRKRGKKLGLTSRCVGGGMGSGEVIEIIE